MTAAHENTDSDIKAAKGAGVQACGLCKSQVTRAFLNMFLNTSMIVTYSAIWHIDSTNLCKTFVAADCHMDQEA